MAPKIIPPDFFCVSNLFAGGGVNSQSCNALHDFKQFPKAILLSCHFLVQMVAFGSSGGWSSELWMTSVTWSDPSDQLTRICCIVGLLRRGPDNRLRAAMKCIACVIGMVVNSGMRPDKLALSVLSQIFPLASTAANILGVIMVKIVSVSVVIVLGMPAFILRATWLWCSTPRSWKKTKADWKTGLNSSARGNNQISLYWTLLLDPWAIQCMTSAPHQHRFNDFTLRGPDNEAQGQLGLAAQPQEINALLHLQLLRWFEVLLLKSVAPKLWDVQIRAEVCKIQGNER